MRVEIEKVLQEQRLEKLKRNFEKQKLEEERFVKQQQWLELQKRQILEGKLEELGQGTTMNHNPPPSTSLPDLGFDQGHDVTSHRDLRKPSNMIV